MYIFWTHHHPITPFTLSTLCTTQTPSSSFISPLLSFPLDTSFPGQLPQEPPGCRMAVVMKALAVGSLVSARAQACKCIAHAVPFETAFSFLFCCQVM